MATASDDRIDTSEDQAWSSDGLVRQQAIRQWHAHWSNRQPTPLDVTLRDPEGFSARWVHYGLGPLRILRLQAPAQRLVNQPRRDVTAASRQLHLIYLLSGHLQGEIGGRAFTVLPGDFVMLDNTGAYVLDADMPHEAIDLIMPFAWLERHMSDPASFLARPISMRGGWAPPLGSLLETLSLHMDSCPLPRTMLAEKIGALLTLATVEHEAPLGSQTGNLTRRIMQRIEADFTDPDLSADLVANELRISKRYLQTLLAKAGTSFVQELNTARLDRASEMLAEPPTQRVSIAEIAFRCGFLDPGYFTRLFRKRFGVTPREWRGPR